MLVPSSRSLLEGSGIDLPAWVRAPLSIGQGSRYWLIAQRKSRHLRRDENKELIVTTISPASWKDLWRIEIETTDEPGTLAHIYRVLEHLNLHTCIAEGNSNILDRSHTMSFVVSAENYESQIDLNTETRYFRPTQALREAEVLLKLNLLDRLGIGSDKELRLKLRPFHAFRELHMDCFVRDTRSILEPEGQIFKDQIDLPKEFKSRVCGAGDEEVRYTVVVDTKLRLARVVFFNQKESPGHVRIRAPAEHSNRALLLMFDFFRENGGNVIRFQLRSAPLAAPKRRSKKKAAAEPHEICLDVTFESCWGHQSNSTLQSKLISRVRTGKQFLASNVAFERSYAEFPR